jgi:hypothetical protein
VAEESFPLSPLHLIRNCFFTLTKIVNFTPDNGQYNAMQTTGVYSCDTTITATIVGIVLCVWKCFDGLVCFLLFSHVTIDKTVLGERESPKKRLLFPFVTRHSSTLIATHFLSDFVKDNLNSFFFRGLDQ